MLSVQRQRNSGDGPAAMTIMVLPDDLVLDILTRLPGKKVGQCKCVCKPWRKMIGSRLFREIYRKRQHGILFYWLEGGNGRMRRWRRFHFFHCPLRRLEEPQEEFSPLCEKSSIGAWCCVTQLVDGLLCVGEEGGKWSMIRMTLHNICTGEKMRLPNPIPLQCVDKYSTYHLGYDPASRVYKLMRLIFCVSDRLLQGAHIMTLRPRSGPPPTWRELDHNAAGINDLHFVVGDGLAEVRICPDDGMLCWLSYSQLHSGRLCFDLNKERFWFVKPAPVRQFGKPRVVTRFDDLNLRRSFLNDKNIGISCYVVEGDQVKNWSRQCLEISEDFEEMGCLILASGANGNMLVMNSNQPQHVHSYSRQPTPHDAYNKDVFSFGKLPERAPNLSYCDSFHDWDCLQLDCGKVCCLLESNNLYLPLDDILGGGSAAI